MQTWNPESRRQAVVFDLGGVLFDWDPRRLYRRVFDDPEKMEWFLANVCTEAWNRTLDSGKPFSVAVRELQENWPCFVSEIAAYDCNWPEMLGEAKLDSVRVLVALQSAKYPVYALTNFSKEKLRIAKRRFRFLARFNGWIVSGEEGVTKPDPEIYRRLLRKFGLSASSTIFIDDRVENVLAARDQGINGIHFTPEIATYRAMARILRFNGIKIPAEGAG